MTNIRTTQALVLALTAGEADARVTQAPVLALVMEASPARVTQAPVLALVDTAPCLTHWAQCWRIERRDGEVFAFTSADMPIVFGGDTYSPCESLSASAAEMGAVLGQIGNAEISGIVSDDSIADRDLIGGLFDGARVEVWMVPWSTSGETPWRLMTGVTGKLSQGRRGYTMEVLTPGGLLQQAAVVQVVTPSCRFELGDARCGFDLGPVTVTGTVTGVAPLSASTTADRRIFADSGRSEADGWFDRGIVTWLTGANAGAEGEVKDYVQATGQFTLWQPMLYPIEPGDTYSAVPGCDLLETTCKTKFNWYEHFGGYDKVPGRDSASQAPDAKQG